MTGKTPVMARITCSNIGAANAVAGVLDALGYTVELTDLIDDTDPYSCAVFLEARCMGRSVDEVFRQVDTITMRYAASCEDVGPDDGRREGVPAAKRAPWRHALAQRKALLKELAAKHDAIVAYHEAGHVVAGYQTGNRLGYGGVRIFGEADADGVEGRTLFHTKTVTEAAGMIRTLGGPVAEARYHGVKSCVAYSEIKKNLQHSRKHHSGNRRCTSFLNCTYSPTTSDDLNITRGILATHPRISNQAALRLVRHYEAKTIKLIDRHWASVERIAGTLIRRRQLSHSTVLRLLPR